MPVIVEGVAVRDLGVDAPDREVHLGQPPGGVVRLLAVNGNVPDLPGVRLDKLLTLHEHAARSATGIVDAALVGREHFDQYAHHIRGRVELPATLAFGACEAGEKVLIHAAECVSCPISGAAKRDVAHQIDDLTKALLVKTWARILFRKYALERWVVALD